MDKNYKLSPERHKSTQSHNRLPRRQLTLGKMNHINDTSLFRIKIEKGRGKRGDEMGEIGKSIVTSKSIR